MGVLCFRLVVILFQKSMYTSQLTQLSPTSIPTVIPIKVYIHERMSLCKGN